MLVRLAGCPKSPRQAVALMAVASMVMALLNWGLSIVGSAVLARALARRVRGLDYRLLVASASLGLGVSLPTTLTAYAWGDRVTDIIEPLWAIPLLSVARLGFLDIMGDCILFFVVYATLVTAEFALA